MSTLIKAGKLVTIIVLLLIVFSLGKNIVSLVNKGMVVRKVRQELAETKRTSQRLKAKLEYVKSRDFLEEEARNNLGLSKGEVVIIMPEGFYQENKNVTEIRKPNWQQWWELLKSGWKEKV